MVGMRETTTASSPRSYQPIVDRRRANRIEYPLPVSMRSGQDGDQVVPCSVAVTRNVSANGIYVYVRTRIPLAQEFLLSIGVEYPWRGSPYPEEFQGMAAVKRVFRIDSELLGVGLAFIEPSLGDDRFLEYISCLQSRPR